MKRFFEGTHRTVSPDTTLRIAGRCAAAAGVTRLADWTGLDRIGLPVFAAIRPMGRSLSMTMGKGVSVAAARASALMEAIEFDAAERAPPAAARAPAGALPGPDWSRVVPTAGGAPFDPGRPRDWLEGVDARAGTAAFAPRALVSMDLTEPGDPDLAPTTNGLASGNTRAEALVGALTELIERAAHRRWAARAPLDHVAHRLDLARLDDPEAALAARVAAAGLDLFAWDMSLRGVPAVLAIIAERPARAPVALAPALGAGCHPDPVVAFARAVTEAAQSRAMMVAGARDDLEAALYADPLGRTHALSLRLATMRPGARALAELSGARHATHEEDWAWLLERLPADQPLVAVDLAAPDERLAVVKLLAPGMPDMLSAAP